MGHRADGLLGVVSQCLPLAWTLLVCPANKFLVMNETMQIHKELQPWHSNVVEISKISSNSNGIDALAKPSITAQDQLLSFHVMLLQRLAFLWRFRQRIRVALRMSLPIKKHLVMKVSLYSYDSLEWTTYPRIILIATATLTRTMQSIHIKEVIVELSS